MAQDPPKNSGGGNTPKPGGNQPKPSAGQSAKERSRAQSRPVSGKAAPTKAPPGRSTAKPKGASASRSSGGNTRPGGGKGGNTPRPGRGASSAKPPRGISGALIAWGVVGLVVVVVAVLVIVNVTSSSTKATGYTPVTPAPASVVKDVTTVPASVYDTVGVTMPAQASPGLPITLSKQPALTLSGKTPAMFYFGAEYCPFCAAERWGIVTGLARFGTWSGLELTASSSTDTYPSTPTFSFRNATFTSSYISFFPVENCTNIPDASNASCSGYTTLQTPTSQEQAVINKYSSPTYIPGATAGSVSFPFMDVGNKVLFSGATYSPQMLAGLTQAEIASHLTDATNSVTQSIIGTANIVSASVCASTNQQPAAVCTSKGVQAAAKALKLS
jgi:Domain of unknown function (DUF929)